MVSVNTLRSRGSPFRVNSWILDSGAFSELSLHGRYRFPVSEYALQIERWRECGQLQAAVAQDYMCEPFILEKTGLTIKAHQELTIERYVDLLDLNPCVYILPVLQGYSPESYVEHVRAYNLLLDGNAWVGVGSVCKRNDNPDAIEDVLLAIKAERPDLRLHAFGIKKTALERPTVRALLYSCDSMAWSFHGRKNGDANDPRHALEYAAEVEFLLKEPQFVQNQLFNWWVP